MSAKSQKKQLKEYDYSGLEGGMRLQVESDGIWYAADVVQVSASQNRKKAPVKISYKGYDGYDEWVNGDRIRSKAIKLISSSDQRLEIHPPQEMVCNKKSHPREWAVWNKLNNEHNGFLSRKNVTDMCVKFDMAESADVLAELMDPNNDGKTTFIDFVHKYPIFNSMRQSALLKRWHRCFGLGVAGNTAGHMAQAGEAEKPAQGTDTPKPATPANIFTFYAPVPSECHSYKEVARADIMESLKDFPVTFAVIRYPKKGSNVQVEPEMGLLVDVIYTKDLSKVERLQPREICAFNDCSIRKLEGATKLSEKKNWGSASKGMSVRTFRVDSISKGSLADRLVIVSYVRRDGQIQKYSQEGAARDYLMFHEELLDWIVERINNQSDCGKWLAVMPDLERSDHPNSMWIALGAGMYTEWGEKNFLLPGDDVVVAIYDEKVFPSGLDDKTVSKIMNDELLRVEGLVSLHQTIIA